MNSPGGGTSCIGLIVLCLFISSLAIGQDQKFFSRSFQSKSDKKTEYVRKYFEEADYTRIEDYVRDTVSHKATIYGLGEDRIDAFAFYCIRWAALYIINRTSATLRASLTSTKKVSLCSR